MILVVTGGRTYNDRVRLFEVQDSIHKTEGIDYLFEGGARGADKLAKEWAIDRSIPRETVDAEWDVYGRYRAGHIRNGVMLRKAMALAKAMTKPLRVVGFPGGNGTADCLAQAELLNIERWVVTEISINKFPVHKKGLLW
jgi:hypothetical protein